MSELVMDDSRKTEAPSIYRPVRHLYVVEGLAAHASNLLFVGIFFYTHQQYQWGIRQNLLLASGQGVIYIFGALSANRISTAIGRRKMLLGEQFLMMALAMVAIFWSGPKVVTLVLLVYVLLGSTVWPAMESLICQNAGGDALSKRLAMYNLVWSGVNAVTLAVSGAIMQHWPAGVFVLVAIAHAISAVVIWSGGIEETPDAGILTPARAEPEPQLLSMRIQALWLARITLPSTYVVVYSLSAMMPSLPVLQSLDRQMQTLVSSVWFISRWGTFLVLGATTFWHRRPRLMLAAAGIMLIAFLGTALRPDDLFPGAGAGPMMNLLSMITWQVLLGAAMGIIYSASLYFGMLLSDGSTEHGGYHEALIGLGSVLGPASAVLADVLRPGRMNVVIGAVAALIGISLIAAMGAARLASTREKA